jgi:hypothetical protein
VSLTSNVRKRTPNLVARKFTHLVKPHLAHFPKDSLASSIPQRTQDLAASAYNSRKRSQGAPSPRAPRQYLASVALPSPSASSLYLPFRAAQWPAYAPPPPELQARLQISALSPALVQAPALISAQVQDPDSALVPSQAPGPDWIRLPWRQDPCSRMLTHRRPAAVSQKQRESQSGVRLQLRQHDRFVSTHAAVSSVSPARSPSHRMSSTSVDHNRQPRARDSRVGMRHIHPSRKLPKQT